MRYISLREAEPGMGLAYDLFDSYGRVLLSKSASLTENYIEKLKKAGFDGFIIEK